MYTAIQMTYIHVYTITTSTPTKELQIFWYSVPSIYENLFSDIEQILYYYKEYKQADRYTGDIFMVTDEQTFREQLTLLGIQEQATYPLALQNGTELQMNAGNVTLAYMFNELYPICFSENELINTFTTNIAHCKCNELISVDIFGKQLFIPKLMLNSIKYNDIILLTSNGVLQKWLSYLANARNYETACKILMQLCSRTCTAEISPATAEPVVQNDESEDRQWVNDFCTLYAEPKDKHDTLLSDIYAQYQKASSWTNTKTLSMPRFLKYLREIPEFTIKRRAKGMVVTNYRFLIDDSTYVQLDKGLICDLTEDAIISIHAMFDKLHANGLPKKKYYLEAIALLGGQGCVFTETLLDQFINNPKFKPVIVKYSTYFNNRQARTDKYTLHHRYETYCEIVGNCKIYYPFADATRHVTERVHDCQPWISDEIKTERGDMKDIAPNMQHTDLATLDSAYTAEPVLSEKWENMF